MNRLIAISALLLAACTTVPRKPEPQEAPRAKAMSVHSVPTGCLVELNGEFVGVTPCDVMFRQGYDGGFGGVDLMVMVVKPLVGPPVPGDIKMWWPGQRIPSEVIFLVHGASKQPEKVADLVVRP